ncbi:MAG: glycosyltransferase family 2 protein [Chloroflexi bacterium]|nr:glycosyltransferase family 2 protein [Chloroflexota bacterium]
MITTFDRPDYLGECLASVAAQTLHGFRLVVLDNASAADYLDVLDRFRDMRITYIRNDTNLGPAGNIEKAMRSYSDSEFVVVFHDDDLMHPNMLEWQYDLLESDPTLQFVSTELAAFDDGVPPPRHAWEGVTPITEIYHDRADLARSLLEGGGLCFGSTMYRSSVLNMVGLDESRFGIIWDRPFLLDVARHGKTALIRAPLVLYRHHPGQDTNRGKLSASNLIELMRSYRDAFPTNWAPGDQELFYRHSVYFLIHYGYSRLAPDDRVGTATFIRRCIRSGVLRRGDVTAQDLATMTRADGQRVVPATIDAARAVKRWLLSRRRDRAGDQPL